ncbi:two pore domain potassium channel family protein, partial [bacterium]|nr:two pore domain potassium channel family protein [bacterium]
MIERKSTTLRQKILGRHPSAFLLIGQLSSLFLYAALDGTWSGRALLGAFGVLLLVLVVWVVKRSPGLNWIAWILAATAAALLLLSWLNSSPSLLMWGSLLEAALYFYAAGSLIAYMMGDYRVTADELFAAGATFT